MESGKLFHRLAILIFVIFIVNTLAIKFNWYYSIWYLDMIIHFVSGIWLGMFFLWLLKVDRESRLGKIKEVMVLVLFAGLGWEVFEFIFKNHIQGLAFDIPDTVSDIFFFLAGGMFAVADCLKRVLLKLKTRYNQGHAEK